MKGKGRKGKERKLGNGKGEEMNEEKTRAKEMRGK